jgi:ribosomal protein S18 acetylase RimI-like enzyme
MIKDIAVSCLHFASSTQFEKQEQLYSKVIRNEFISTRQFIFSENQFISVLFDKLCRRSMVIMLNKKTDHFINFADKYKIQIMHMTIRPAQQHDASIVPEIMLQAMEDIIFRFIGKQDKKEAVRFLTDLFQQTGNLYSYENTFVAVDDEGNILGSLTGYDGDNFITLRQPILDHIQKEYSNELIPEPETEGQEFYIDSVAVSPVARGKGIGSELLKYATKHAEKKGLKQIGLLVDIENPGARKLYERIGFKVGSKITFAGGQYYHMYIQFA